MNRILPALLLALAAAAAAEPDSLGWVTGRVSDSATGEPLVCANVADLDSDRGAATDTDGSYIVTLPAGLHRLETWYHRYEPESLDATVTTGDTTVLDFALQPDTLWLDQEADCRRAEARYDSIRPILAATKWDVTIVYDHLTGRQLLAPDPALADSVAVWALRAWKADTGSFHARKVVLDPDDGDTILTDCLLIGDGGCTAVLQQRQHAPPDVVSPQGGAIVDWVDMLHHGHHWTYWDCTKPGHLGRLRLLLQVEGQPPDKPYIF